MEYKSERSDFFTEGLKIDALKKATPLKQDQRNKIKDLLLL